MQSRVAEGRVRCARCGMLVYYGTEHVWPRTALRALNEALMLHRRVECAKSGKGRHPLGRGKDWP